MLSLLSLSLALISLCLSFSPSYAKSSTGDSVLVLLDEAQKADYSIFFKGLEEKGYYLTFRGPRDETPLLVEYDVPKFDHIMLLGTDSKVFARDITPQVLVKLVEKKVNFLVALSQKQNFLTSLAAEFSLILPPPGTPLISYFPERSDSPAVIPITVSSQPMLSKSTPPVWFSGVPFALGNNPLLVPILNAPAESFAADSDAGADAVADSAERGGEGLWAGSSMGVVTGFQALSDARVTWIGGPEILGDAFAKKEVSKGVKSGNTQFALDVASWTFQESLVLRVDGTSHHLVNGTSKEEYTVNDNIVYTAHISQYNAKDGVWEPYSGVKDLQLEFTMLDPFIRTALPPVPGKPGTYSTTFRAPDRHGVFKFVINHKRKGWTHLHSSTTVSVVPPRHDGYPRFLSAAWPYYVGAISTSVGFFLFSAIWLSGDVRELREQKKGKGLKSE